MTTEGTELPLRPAPKDAEESFAAREEAVIKKETATSYFLEIMEGIKDKIVASQATPSDMDLPGWVSTLENICKDHENFKFFVGVAGDTGLGKSMLLNTIINDEADIAPSSQHSACTAAVCCFQYHQPKSSGSTYTAKVKLKSLDTVNQELATLFQEIKELEDRVKLEGTDENTAGEQAKFRDQMKMISGWSAIGVDRVKELGFEKSSQITMECRNAQDLFDITHTHISKVLTIESGTPPKFLRDISPYIGSTTTKRGSARWPLVEQAEISLPSPFLQRCPGLVMVDLPGEMDALESRSQVSRQYYDSLDRMLVITPSDRAQDNRTASDLIRADQVTDLEASGKLDDDSFAVVITKVDHLDWVKFVDNEVEPESLGEVFVERKALYDTKKEELEGIEERIRELKETSHDEMDEPASSNSHSKRKLGASSASHERQAISQAMSQRQMIECEVNELFAYCLGACIKFRAEMSKKGLQDHFDQIRSRSSSPTQLSVISVSSKAQQGLARNNPQQGFPDPGSTGFNDLKQWIIAGTLQRREERADNILYRAQVLFDAIEGWALGSTLARGQLPSTNKPRIDDVLSDQKDIMRENLTRIEKNLGKHLSHHPPFAKNNKMDTTTQSLTALVDKFSGDSLGNKLHWSTYAACVRRNGGLYRTSSKPRRIYCWQGRIYGQYWTKRAGVWGVAYNQKLPAYQKNIFDSIQVHMSAHIDALKFHEGLPEQFKEAFKKIAYKEDNLLMEYQTSILSRVKTFRQSVARVRIDSRGLMSEAMKEGFIEASKIHGKQVNKRQIALLHDYAMKNGTDIINKISQDIHNQMEKLCKSLKADHRAMHNELIKKVVQIEGQLARELCASASGISKQQPLQDRELRDSLQGDIEVWKEYWNNAGLPPIRLPTLNNDQLSNDEEPVGAAETKSKGSRKGAGARTGVAKAAPKRKRPATSKKATGPIEVKDEHGSSETEG